MPNSPSNPPEAPPTSQALVAGKFELIRLIGRGGMGSVWEGRHSSLGTRVAIKFVEKDYAESPEALARFQTEAHAVARLQSRYVIKIFDHGVTTDGRPFIVMEFLRGETLDERLQRVGRLSVVDTARLFSQVCKALGRAHDEGIIHRDMKPENIFLAVEDDEEVAKVLDFGIAKMRETAPGSTGASISSSTKTGAVLGTPYYMSPEQARGLRGVDHRTDLWSLGVIIYRCVVGELPFSGQSVGDLLVNICTAPLPIPSRAAPGVHPEFDAWFMRALSREPDGRFRSAAELCETLVAVANGSTMPSAGITFPMPHSPAPSMLTPRPSLGGGPSSLPMGTAAPFTADRISSLPQRKTGWFVLAGVGVLVLGIGGAAVAVAFAKRSTVTVAAQGASVGAAQSSIPMQDLPPSSSALAGAMSVDLKPIEPIHAAHPASTGAKGGGATRRTTGRDPKLPPIPPPPALPVPAKSPDPPPKKPAAQQGESASEPGF